MFLDAKYQTCGNIDVYLLVSIIIDRGKMSKKEMLESIKQKMA